MATLPVSGTHHDQLLNRLHVPRLGSLSEFHRQPIEQFRVRRKFGLRTEILGGLHQASPEVFLPQPVHPDTTRQWIGWIDDPSGQIEAI